MYKASKAHTFHSMHCCEYSSWMSYSPPHPHHLLLLRVCACLSASFLFEVLLSFPFLWADVVVFNVNRGCSSSPARPHNKYAARRRPGPPRTRRLGLGRPAHHSNGRPPPATEASGSARASGPRRPRGWTEGPAPGLAATADKQVVTAILRVQLSLRRRTAAVRRLIWTRARRPGTAPGPGQQSRRSPRPSR